MILTSEQTTIRDAMLTFAKYGGTYMTVGGYAGTGKTTLLSATMETLMQSEKPPVVVFCCYTGKAASVLRAKLKDAGILHDEMYVGTIHGLIYEPDVVGGVIIGWNRVPAINADLIIVDEASMVNKEIWDDLRSYGVPIIAVGDHGQLPPIEGAFNLMERPDYKLEKIHRQAEDNPIIKLSMIARMEGEIKMGPHGAGVMKMNAKNDEVLDKAHKWRGIRNTLFLCGTNRTRISINKAVRGRLGYATNVPQNGEKLICLRNNRQEKIFNGMCGTLTKIHNKNRIHYNATIAMEDESDYHGQVVIDQFGAEKTLQEHPFLEQKDLKDLFDFGYCLTVHKAQGSEAETVVLFEERFSQSTDDQWRRWLYTAVTRARKHLMIVNRRYDRVLAAKR